MDLSKLPRLSKTPTPPAEPAAALSENPTAASRTAMPTMRPCPYCAAPVRADARFCDACGARLGRRNTSDQIGVGVEIWVMAILGLIFILVGKNFASYEFSRLTHRAYHTGMFWGTIPPHTGEEVLYPELEHLDIWNDSAYLFFGIVMVLDGIARGYAALRLPGRRAIVGFTLLLTILTTLYNAFVVAKVFSLELPLFSILAVAIGGFLAYLQWLLYIELRAARPASPI